ncbi:hypothetical protein ANO11243_022440 [Dothideomycetidae sp. 11243]|nr:hypothetical protein ANO11243_022440 [fungal sp. No.11243]
MSSKPANGKLRAWSTPGDDYTCPSRTSRDSTRPAGYQTLSTAVGEAGSSRRAAEAANVVSRAEQDTSNRAANVGMGLELLPSPRVGPVGTGSDPGRGCGCGMWLDARAGQQSLGESRGRGVKGEAGGEQSRNKRAVKVRYRNVEHDDDEAQQSPKRCWNTCYSPWKKSLTWSATCCTA